MDCIPSKADDRQVVVHGVGGRERGLVCVGSHRYWAEAIGENPGCAPGDFQDDEQDHT